MGGIVGRPRRKDPPVDDSKKKRVPSFSRGNKGPSKLFEDDVLGDGTGFGTSLIENFKDQGAEKWRARTQRPSKILKQCGSRVIRNTSAVVDATLAVTRRRTGDMLAEGNEFILQLLGNNETSRMNFCHAMGDLIVAAQDCAGNPAVYLRAVQINEVLAGFVYIMHAVAQAKERQASKEPAKTILALFQKHCHHGPGKEGGQVDIQLRRGWVFAVAALRKQAAKTMATKQPAASSSSLLYLQLTFIESGLYALPDPGAKGRLIKAGLKFVKGVGRTVAAGGVPDFGE